MKGDTPAGGPSIRKPSHRGKEGTETELSSSFRDSLKLMIESFQLMGAKWITSVLNG